MRHQSRHTHLPEYLPDPHLAACSRSPAELDFAVRIHDLRHVHASWLLAGGAALKSVMERMGHSQIQTIQKYLHTLPDTDQRNLAVGCPSAKGRS
jgi:integrase